MRRKKLLSFSPHDHGFFFRFSAVALTCLFAGFVFTSSRLVWDPFSKLNPKRELQLLTIFILYWFVFTHVLTSSCPAGNLLSNVSRRLLASGVWGRTISISGGCTLVQKIWDLCSFNSFLLTIVIHQWQADLQPVVSLNHSKVSEPFP